ncbi:hypothetical protein ACLMJK_007878 [Lecanora helva]
MYFYHTILSSFALASLFLSTTATPIENENHPRDLEQRDGGWTLDCGTTPGLTGYCQGSLGAKCDANGQRQQASTLFDPKCGVCKCNAPEAPDAPVAPAAVPTPIVHPPPSPVEDDESEETNTDVPPAPPLQTMLALDCPGGYTDPSSGASQSLTSFCVLAFVSTST